VALFRCRDGQNIPRLFPDAEEPLTTKKRREGRGEWLMSRYVAGNGAEEHDGSPWAGRRGPYTGRKGGRERRGAAHKFRLAREKGSSAPVSLDDP